MIRYYIKEEVMGGKTYYMIYRKWLFWESYYERWNSQESANIRLAELN